MLTLRPYQRAALEALHDCLARTRENPLLVLPTASGKSLCMAAFVKETLEADPLVRILIVTHVRELIEQSHAELLGHWPQAPVGIYSAGLGRRELGAPITLAGIQSIYRKARELGGVDLALVDEAHLIPRVDSMMYRQFLGELQEASPALRVVGLTATPYRLDSGLLHQGENALFDRIAYEANVRELIEQGYLARIVGKAPYTQLEVSGVASRGGDFIPGQLEAAVDVEPVTRAAVREMVTLGQERRSWLVFGAGLEHCRHLATAIRAHGIEAACLFGGDFESGAGAAGRAVHLRRAALPGERRRPDHRLQCAGRRPDRPDAADPVAGSSCPADRSRHAHRTGQEQLPDFRLRRQCRTARADRCGPGEGRPPSQVARRSAGQDLSRVSDDRPCRGPVLRRVRL